MCWIEISALIDLLKTVAVPNRFLFIFVAVEYGVISKSLIDKNG